jgi:phage tail-like protein
VRDGADLTVRPTAAVPPPDPAPDCLRQAPAFEPHTWRPWDIALSCDCRAFVSDYENGLVHVFDPAGRWREAYTGEGGGAPAFERPTHIALDKECRLYVVQEGKDYVTVLDADGKFVGQVKSPEEVKGRFCPVAVAVDASGNLCVSDCAARRVYTYARAEDGTMQPSGEWRAFEGAGAGIAFDLSGNALLSDAGQRRVCRMSAAAAYELEGRYYSEPLDSRIYQCRWHRVVLCASVESGTQLRVDTFSSESPKTAAEITGLPESRWATGQTHARVGAGEWDCLVQSPPGRYLWLRLTFTSEGATTPALYAARVYFPRDSSLQHLPAVYSEDGAGRDFLDRFLSIFDTLWGGVSEKLDRIASYFDPEATPAGSAQPGATDFLSWLASWLDLTLDRHWPEEKRRRLLASAHRLYALRGTPDGLRLHVRLYTDAEPRILEHFRLRRWTFLGHARLGDQTALWGERVVRRLQLDEFSRVGEFQLIDTGDPLRDPFYAYAHQFTVFVPLRGEASRIERQTVERIVEMAKPAHALARVEFVRPRLRVGVQSFVGVDTVVGRYPTETLAGQARLGHDSMLGPSADESAPPTMRVGVRTRIGSSTLID